MAYSTEYNENIRFDGDIIITDPCYFVKSASYADYPCWWDYITRFKLEVKKGKEYHHLPSAKDYPDCREMTLNDLNKYMVSGQDFYESKVREFIKLKSSGRPIMISDTLEHEKELYHQAEQNWKLQIRDDWEYCEYGDKMELLGFTTFLSAGTIYGDWFCTVYKLNPQRKRKLGNFCADAGMVGVFLLDEVLKYNPEFLESLKNPRIATVIKDFHGNIMLKRISKRLNAANLCRNYDDRVEVVGKGNINFVGYQTGF